MQQTSSPLIIDSSWKQALEAEFQAWQHTTLMTFLEEERAQYEVYPPVSEVFAAFNQVPLKKVKVVILGQDPYHGPGQANGLCFSVNRDMPLPPSLRNIYKELKDDLGLPPAPHGDLEKWSSQGVLLMNATLTVRARQPGSHQKKGWEQLTDSMIKVLSSQRKGLVFLLWGNYAGAKSTLIDSNRHHILKAAHPSPLSAYRGFFGCRHFSQTNALLRSEGKAEIDWCIE
ncbi:MAG: uracil-DNA glycosylase [Bacteroidales bacterium]